MAMDFVSPESIKQIMELTERNRKLPRMYFKHKRDTLEVSHHAQCSPSSIIRVLLLLTYTDMRNPPMGQHTGNMYACARVSQSGGLVEASDLRMKAGNR